MLAGCGHPPDLAKTPAGIAFLDNHLIQMEFGTYV